MDIWFVFLLALGTSLATGLGVLPLALFRHRTDKWAAISNALAAGSMVGASLGLLYEGGTIDVTRVAIGTALGALFVVASRALLPDPRDLRVGTLRGAGARRALLVIGVMTVHSFTEGVGVGVAFADSDSLGLLIAIAIAVHNIPEGLTIGLALVPAGTTLRAAAGWAIFTSLPQPLMAVPSYLGVEIVDTLLPAGLGFAAGAMLWLSLVYVVPEALSGASRTEVVMSGAGGAIAMLVLGAVLAF